MLPYSILDVTARWFFFFAVFRNAMIIIVLTFASWLYCRHRVSESGKYPIKILQTVPRGFQHMGQPHIDPKLVSALAGGTHSVSALFNMV